MNRKCRQNVATDDRRTFTDKDKVRRIQTLGNDNKDAMLDCESGFHQSEDKRKLNCHIKLRSRDVTKTRSGEGEWGMGNGKLKMGNENEKLKMGN